MLSRIFWVGVAGIALIAGMALQDGPRIISWDHDEPPVHKASSIDEKVDRALDRSFDKMHVTDADGEEIDVPAKTKRAMADAVGRLVKAEADLAMARIGEDDQEAMKAASARRDKARADIDRLKAEIRSSSNWSNVPSRLLSTCSTPSSSSPCGETTGAARMLCVV